MNEQEILDGGWLVNNQSRPVSDDVYVDTYWRYGGISSNKQARSYYWTDKTLLYWRLHKPEVVENSTTEFKGLETGWDNNNESAATFSYPKTSYIAKSDAELKAEEKAFKDDKILRKLKMVADAVNSVSGKNFSIADIELVDNLLHSFYNWEWKMENK